MLSPVTCRKAFRAGTLCSLCFTSAKPGLCPRPVGVFVLIIVSILTKGIPKEYFLARSGFQVWFSDHHNFRVFDFD